MARMMKKRLGDLLVEEGVITERQIQVALAKQKKFGKKLGEILVDLGYCDREDIIKVLGDQLGIAYVELERIVITPEVLSHVPKELALKYKLIPFLRNSNLLHVAMEDPLDIYALDELEAKTGLEIHPAISSRNDILRAIAKSYSDDGTELSEDTFDEYLKEEIVLREELEESSVIEIVEMILKRAVRERASDIHIESEQDDVRVRFRVDGILFEALKLPKEIESSVASRIKIMSKMNISEKRIPQDGRINFIIGQKEIDLRVSTLPTIFGEKIVIRILDKSNVTRKLDVLGFSGEHLKSFRKLIKRPNGIIFVTGPTGSGKTSTLYAALNEINSIDKNIITLEDPVEYQLKIINQVQVNPSVGLSFANGLRSVLRQDPDVIMIGEIRDKVTADIAIEAAMTGHLVFSTLHTNSAVGTIGRLIDMGVDHFLISSSLIGVVGQRLARELCPHCKKQINLKGSELNEFDLEADREYLVYKAVGCNKCKNTGYIGRTVLAEILEIDENIRGLISRGESTSEIKKVLKNFDIKSIMYDGLEKVLDGTTSVEEVLRVAQDEI